MAFRVPVLVLLLMLTSAGRAEPIRDREDAENGSSPRGKGDVARIWILAVGACALAGGLGWYLLSQDGKAASEPKRADLGKPPSDPVPRISP
jgi:hypothetical protein